MCFGMQIMLLSVMFLFSVRMSAQSPQPAAPDKGVLVSVRTLTSADQPVSGVGVSLGPYSGTSDESGRVSMNGVLPGAYQLSASFAGLVLSDETTRTVTVTRDGVAGGQLIVKRATRWHP